MKVKKIDKLLEKSHVEKNLVNSIVVLFIIGTFFIVASYFSQTYSSELESLIGNSLIGMGIYVLLNILEVIIAPVNLLPTIPLAVNLWGVTIAVLLTVSAWTIGAVIAFLIARKYGINLVKKFVSLEKIHAVGEKIPDKNIFWTIVLLRMFLPSDVLSYVMGLFSRIKIRHFALATFIGFTPLAIIFAYVGVLPIMYQIIGLLVLIVIFIIWYYLSKRIDKLNILK